MVAVRPPMNQIVTVKVGTRSAGLRNEGGSVLRSTREKHRGPCGAVVCHQICSALCGRRGEKKDDKTSTGAAIPSKRPLILRGCLQQT